jgi:hypothetical protein
MKTYKETEIKLHTFLTAELDGSEWSAVYSGRFTSRENSSSYLLDRRLDEPDSWSGRGGQAAASRRIGWGVCI